MDKEVYAFFRYLKEKLPTAKPTYLRTRDLKKYDGITNHKSDSNIIVLDKKLQLGPAIDCLIHEYAHCGSGYGGAEDAHTADWARWYGRTYRAYVKFKYHVGDW